MVVILPWIALALLFTTILYGFLMVHYRKSGADLQVRSKMCAALAVLLYLPRLNGSLFCAL